MLTDKFFAIADLGHEATLFILVILSILSLAFILERYFALSTVEKDNQNLTKELQSAIGSKTFAEVEELNKNHDSFIGKAFDNGIRHCKANGPDGLEEVFDSYSLSERGRLEKRLSFLATVGSNAPFIGLLGTVFGIMDAFRGLSTSQGDISAVMAGISQALVATAVGLLVAIPAVVAYNYFQRKVKAILQSLEAAKNICLVYAKTRKGS